MSTISDLTWHRFNWACNVASAVNSMLPMWIEDTMRRTSPTYHGLQQHLTLFDLEICPRSGRFRTCVF